MVRLSWTEDHGDQMVHGANMNLLSLDEAYVILKNGYYEDTFLLSAFKECIDCSFTNGSNLIAKYDKDIYRISTKHELLWRVVSKNLKLSPSNSTESVICNLNPKLGEFGVYSINVTKENCILNTIVEPVNIYFPLMTVFIIYAVVLLFVSTTIYVWTVYTTPVDVIKTPSGKSEKKRIQSLDTFRGVTIALMIFVNYGCGGYELLDHAVWDGLHMADVIFPWFMWIMGVCIPISTKSILKTDIPLKNAVQQIIRRSAILFLLGLILGASPYLENLRIFGVLQRFAICYFVVATIYLTIAFRKGLKPEMQNTAYSISKFVLELLRTNYQWICIIVFFAIYEMFVLLLPGPGCPHGYRGPGGGYKKGEYFFCTGGAVGYLDKVILGKHRYRFPTTRKVFNSTEFDPEGILGCLTSIAQVFIGAEAGKVILENASHKSRLIKWAIWAVVLGICGGFLCNFFENDGLIPVNKNLWSVSFVLVTSSLAFLFLILCYIVIDVKSWWTGKPFLFAGMNSIIMYVGHSLTYSSFPFRWIPAGHKELNTHFLMTMENLWGTAGWILIAYFLYRNKFFLKI